MYVKTESDLSNSTIMVFLALPPNSGQPLLGPPTYGQWAGQIVTFPASSKVMAPKHKKQLLAENGVGHCTGP